MYFPTAKVSQVQETLPYQEHFEKKIVTKIARTAEVCHCQTDSSAAPLVVMATFVFVTYWCSWCCDFDEKRRSSVCQSLMCKIVIELFLNDDFV